MFWFGPISHLPATGPTPTLTLVLHKPFLFSQLLEKFIFWCFFLIVSSPPKGEKLQKKAHVTAEATSKSPSLCRDPPRPKPPLQYLGLRLHQGPADPSRGGFKLLSIPLPQFPFVGRGCEALPSPQRGGRTEFSGLRGTARTGMLPTQKGSSQPAPASLPYARLPTGRAGRYTNKELVNEINERGRPARI